MTTTQASTFVDEFLRNISPAWQTESDRGSCLTYLDELREVICRFHGAEATHIESLRVTAVFRDEMVWNGVVEIFDLAGHPEARLAYAWSHGTDDPETPNRHVAVLHLPPMTSEEDAVRALIMDDVRLARRNRQAAIPDDTLRP